MIIMPRKMKEKAAVSANMNNGRTVTWSMADFSSDLAEIDLLSDGGATAWILLASRTASSAGPSVDKARTYNSAPPNAASSVVVNGLSGELCSLYSFTSWWDP
jgi:hypothetical protein